MKSKMNSMYINQVWTLINPPKGIKRIGSKQILKRKVVIDGNVQTYKLNQLSNVTNKNKQVDFDETFLS